jgi:hypothetical protein
VRCPVCGDGVLGDIVYDEHDEERLPKQAPESRELLIYSCGHEVEARRLGEAARDDANVERRNAQEAAGPIESRGETP